MVEAERIQTGLASLILEWVSSRVKLGMIADLLVRYLHFVSILALSAALLGQWLFISREMSRRRVIMLQKLDIIYGLGAVLVLVTGFLQWFVVGKPAVYYSENGLFHVKVTLFLVIGLVSIYPSVFFGRRRKGDPDETLGIPAMVIWSVRVEVMLLLIMPLLATLMARGIGLEG